MKNLLRLLELAQPIVSKRDQPDYHLSLMLHNAKTGQNDADRRLVDLLDEVRKHPELSIFDGSMQVIGSSAVRFDYSNLVHWLINRAAKVNAKEAIRNLKKYLSAKEIKFIETYVLSGLKIDNICHVGEGVNLIPWDELTESHQKKYIFEKFIDFPNLHFPESALTKERKIKRIHVSQDDVDKFIKTKKDTHLQDALLCLSLVGPIAPYVLASWLQSPDWMPILGHSYSFPPIERHFPKRGWPTNGCNKARKLFKAFSVLNDNGKAVLRLPMQRLSSAMRRNNHVDAAIDLGIVFESLFLRDINGDRGELTFRLKLRASKLLGDNYEERRRFFKVFGDLYKVRSIAVHTGKVPDKVNRIPINELIENGFSLAAKAISRIIFEGEPDWQAIILN